MFTDSLLEAAVYRFEMANGRKLTPYEFDCVAAAGLENIDPHDLADNICSYLDTSPQPLSEKRSAAFFALGKSYDTRLLQYFRRHLAHEIHSDMAVAYQIMIALDNLAEPVWKVGMSSFSFDETELNHEAATRYLAECV